MEKNHEIKIIKGKMDRTCYSNIMYQQNHQKMISNEDPRPNKCILSSESQKELKSKNINNKTLTDWNKRKIYRRIIQNAPAVPKLYLKKRVDSKNQPYLSNAIQKKELSCNHKKIGRYKRKVAFDSKNLSKKKSFHKHLIQNSDLDKDIGIEDDPIQINEPHMTDKKKYNYFYCIPKTESKTSRYEATTKKFFDENIKENKPHHIFHRAKKYLFNNNKNNSKEKEKKNLCENRYEFISGNKMNYIRAKTSKKKEENKEFLNSNRYNNHNFINIVVHSNNCHNMKQIKKDFFEQEIRKNPDSEIINSIKINKEEKVNKIISLHSSNNIGNKLKIKKYNLNLNNHFQLITKRRNFQKKLNLSYINNSNQDIININTNNNTNNNIQYIGNKTSIKNTSSDFISGEETKDSPENITDREDEKDLSIHKINHFFININESKEKKVDKSCSKFNNKNSLFSNFDFDTDENCIIHKSNISIVNNDNISSYKKNMERFKKLTTEKKIPLSFFLSPLQKSNLFNENKNPKIENKNMKNICSFNLIDFFANKRDKKDNKIKICIENFLDFKSLLQLSSVNRAFFKNARFFLFKFVFNKSIGANINRNDQKVFITKIITSLFKYSSIKIKSSKEIRNIYSLYKKKSKYDEEITKDLTRTFPKDKSFSKDSKNSHKLYNVLTCYSNFNKNIGYAQGLNFIAAISICMFDKEEISFMFLDSLINRFELNNYLSIDNKNLIGKLSHFSKYLKKYIPDIISFLDKYDINHGFFSHGWILTLFSNSMRKEYLIHTWAFMIIFGWKFFYSFVIQILLWYKKDIFKSNINSLCSKMKNILADDDFGKNFRSIIKNTFNFMNKNIVL